MKQTIASRTDRVANQERWEWLSTYYYETHRKLPSTIEKLCGEGGS